MLIKDRFCVDLEGLRDRGGRHTYFVAMEDSQSPGVFHVGGYKYDAEGNPLTRYAPKVIDVWSSMDEPKSHARDRRLAMDEDTIELFKAFDAIKNAHIPWKERTKLFDLPYYKSLTGTCQTCGLAVTTGVRRLIEEARYGARTVAEIETVSVCRRIKCRGKIVLELAKDRYQ